MICKIKYFDNEIDKIKKIDKGDWIDLRAAETVEIKAGEFKLIKLGVGMILPEGYEAHIVPRSSTFKNFGVIQTNHMGVVDESYNGDNDQWMFPAYALRDTVIHKNDRICQFRIVEKQPEINFIIVEKLTENNRGGFGSTGVNVLAEELSVGKTYFAIMYKDDEPYIEEMKSYRINDKNKKTYCFTKNIDSKSPTPDLILASEHSLKARVFNSREEAERVL